VKGNQISRKKPTFVISDLHIGDRSPKDSLCRAGRERLLNTFLDHVEDQNGQLVIIGDLFELLRYPLESIIARRRDLLDRFAAMRTVYIPGNHDEEVVSLIDPKKPPHPFFAGMSDDFIRCIGGRRFKFTHGHEVDPFIKTSIQNLSRVFGALAYQFESRKRTCPVPRSTGADTLLEESRRIRPIRGRLRRRMSRALDVYYRTPAQKVRLMTRQLRTDRMLTSYHGDRLEGLYDVAIVGHTHTAAALGDWYFNSGSWTERTNDFLEISPDGRVDVLHWNLAGSQPNKTTLAA